MVSTVAAQLVSCTGLERREGGRKEVRARAAAGWNDACEEGMPDMPLGPWLSRRTACRWTPLLSRSSSLPLFLSSFPRCRPQA